MPLEFINRLNEEQLIALINYGNKKRHSEYFVEVTSAKILAEPYRCDEFGNQEVYINAWNGNHHIGSYLIQDFQMFEIMNVNIEPHNNELREYLASIFGEEYLNALRNYYLLEAEKEIERIKSNLGKGRS